MLEYMKAGERLLVVVSKLHILILKLYNNITCICLEFDGHCNRYKTTLHSLEVHIILKEKVKNNIIYYINT